jgi:hypothetical protein
VPFAKPLVPEGTYHEIRKPGTGGTVIWGDISSILARVASRTKPSAYERRIRHKV